MTCRVTLFLCKTFDRDHEDAIYNILLPLGPLPSTIHTCNSLHIMPSYSPDQLVLNYHDACIYGRDLFTLEDPCGWLTADVLHFFAERYCCCCETTTTSLVMMMDPSVVLWFLHQLEEEEDDGDEMIDFARQIQKQLQHKDLLCIPVNNVLGSSQWMQPQNQQHWSLLVLDKNNNKWYHLDSVQKSSNSQAAQRVATRWQRIMNTTQSTITSSSLDKDTASTILIHEIPNVPQQTNGYDCGVHVLVAVEALSANPCSCCEPKNWGNAIAHHLAKESTQQFRQRLANEIRRLAAEIDI